jgi:hypothetical protein
MKAHLELMEKHFQNLNAIGSTWDGAQYSQLILSSLPESYQPIVQTLSVQQQSTRKLPDSATLYKIIMNEVTHWVILAEKGNRSESPIYAKNKSRKVKKQKVKFSSSLENVMDAERQDIRKINVCQAKAEVPPIETRVRIRRTGTRRLGQLQQLQRTMTSCLHLPVRRISLGSPKPEGSRKTT